MSNFLKENNYLYLPEFINVEEAKILAEELKEFGKIQNEGTVIKVTDRISCRNYVTFLELLCERVPDISHFIGEKVLPTFSDANLFTKGTVLKPWTERDACEVCVIVKLDGDAKWPLFIKKPNGEKTSLVLKPGDAMLYLANETEQWREAYTGNEYVQVTLNYVKSRGNNRYAYFDKAEGRPNEIPISLTTPDMIKQAKIEKIDESNAIAESPKIETIEPKIEIDTNVTAQPRDILDYIVEIENVVPDWLIDAIFREYESCKDWSKAGTLSGVLQDVRNVDEIGLSLPSVIEKNKMLREYLDKELFECAKVAILKYNEKFPHSKIQDDSGYQLLRYDTGQFYKEHCDNHASVPRTISCSFALNDDYYGGEWAFFNGDVKKKQKRGSALMFPSNFMFPHQILPVLDGTRYSIITWFK
jgi:hypothetical protein